MTFYWFSEAFGTTWNKHYCTYNKETKDLTMIPYNQITNKFVSNLFKYLKNSKYSYLNM